MIINKIVKWIVQLIMGSIEKFMYESEKQHAQEAIDEAKRSNKAAKQESDRAVSAFKLKLEQYRKQQSERNLRRTIDRVQSGSRNSATDDTDSGAGNKETE